MSERISKINYYLNIADEVSKRSTCLRRRYGAVIVNHDEIVSTGYNGAPRGVENCTDHGICTRKELNIPRGQRTEICRAVHSEENAIISASRKDMIGGDLYLSGREVDTGEYVVNVCSCSMCKKRIINAGIKNVYIRDNDTEYRKIPVEDWIHDVNALIGVEGY